MRDFCLALTLATLYLIANTSSVYAGEVNGMSGTRDVKEYYDNGNIKSNIAYKNGVMHGLAKYYYEDGPLEKEHTYVNGKKTFEKKYYPDGNLQVIVVIHPDWESMFRGTTFYPDGAISSFGTFLNRKLHGEFIQFWKNGYLRSIGNYIDGEMQGQSTYYYPSGEVMSYVSFQNSLWHGLHATFFRSGKIKGESGSYWGASDGVARRYSESGEIIFENNFLKGKWDNQYNDIHPTSNNDEKIYFYFENGNVDMEIPFKNGVIEGDVKEYYQTGELMSSAAFVDNKPHGKSTFFMIHGSVKRLSNYKNGNAHGDIILHDDVGIPGIKLTFVDGVLEKAVSMNPQIATMDAS